MAPRRAKKQTPAQRARSAKQAEGILTRTLKEAVNDKQARKIQNFAVRAMNSLSQAGPAWTGEFSASWGFALEGVTPITPGTTGSIYKYTKYDVPLRYVRRLVEEGRTRFSISNTSPHASIAIDESPGVFERSGVPIKKDSWEFGDANPRRGMRYDIGRLVDANDPDAYSSRTAETDWYINYLIGGGLQKDLNVSFTFDSESIQ